MRQVITNLGLVGSFQAGIVRRHLRKKKIEVTPPVSPLVNRLPERWPLADVALVQATVFASVLATVRSQLTVISGVVIAIS